MSAAEPKRGRKRREAAARAAAAAAAGAATAAGAAAAAAAAAAAGAPFRIAQLPEGHYYNNAIDPFDSDEMASRVEGAGQVLRDLLRVTSARTMTWVVKIILSGALRCCFFFHFFS